MNTATHERGQALILIVFAIVGLVGVTGLAVDGGLAYSDRRAAQNAADNSALAAALAFPRGRNIVDTAYASALNSGFNNNGATNAVSVSVADLPLGACPNLTAGKDITVEITSHVTTYFAPVLGVRQLTNRVSATARSCESYVGPMFNGDAIVALTPNGTGFDAHGTPVWNVVNGGIFSNSSSSSSATCGGNSGVTTPSVTVVGGTSFTCHHVSIGTISTAAPQLTYADYSSMLPPTPKCTGTAFKNAQGMWQQVGSEGSKVALNGDMHFAPGLYCITNSPGPFHGQITGTWVTFYIMPTNFNLKFNGGGNLTATAPISGSYAGVLMFSAAQLSGDALQNRQSIDLRGNGTGDIQGSIIMPSASVTMFGNSSSKGLHTQVIAYNVDSGGNADINIVYHSSDLWQAAQPAWLTLLR